MKLLVTLALLCAASAFLLSDAEAALRCDDDDRTGAGVECMSFEKLAMEVQS